MYAAQNSYMNDAAQKLYEAGADFMIRENCRRRREQEIRGRHAAELEIQVATLQNENSSLQNEIVTLRAKLAKYES